MNRNITIVSAASFLMSFGEELWKRFLPKYLESLGAPVTAIGFYGTLKDFIDGVYQYPGGWLTDHYGRRRAFLLFITIATTGYLGYFLAPSWPYVIAGVFLVMAWSSMANPTFFAIIGDSLPRERRAIGFTMQSMLRRIPIGITASIGGLLIATYGITRGVRISLLITMVLALLTAVVASRIQLPEMKSVQRRERGEVWRMIPAALRRLLTSDILIRVCEGMVDVLIVLYAIDVIGVTAPQFGLLVSIQVVTSIAVYIPAAKVGDRVGRKPFIIATFLFFALYPLSIVLASGMAGLVTAFIIGGLREIGEPARKAMIVDFALPEFRGRVVGLYYLVRSVSIAPAALVGGLLWKITPATPFFVASVFGVVGAMVFAVTVKEER